MTSALSSLSVCAPTRILLDIAPNSYRAVLQKIAHQISEDLYRPYAGVMEALSKGAGAAVMPLGLGVLVIDQTIPGLDMPYVLLARLVHAVDVHADDHRPVDLIMIILSSDEDKIAHIRLVSRMTRVLHDLDVCALIRGSGSEDSVLTLFSSLQNVSLPSKAA